MRGSHDTLRTAAALGVVFLTLLAAPAAASVNLSSHAGSGHAGTAVTVSFDDNHRQGQSSGTNAGSSNESRRSSGSRSSSGSSVTPVTSSGAS